jgi:hypothetical protein
MIHVARDGKRIGSFEVNTLRSMALAGELTQNDHVYYPKTQEWKLISDVPELSNTLFGDGNSLLPPPPIVTPGIYTGGAIESEIDAAQQVESMRESSHASDDSPLLWNPMAAAVVGFFLSFFPISQYLHYKNWIAIGDKEKEEYSKVWFLGAGGVSGAMIRQIFTSKPAPDWLYVIPVAYGFIWYYFIGHSQVKFIESRFGKNYRRKPIWKPILVVVAVSIVLAIAASYLESEDEPQNLRSTHHENLAQEPRSTALDIPSVVVSFDKYIGKNVRVEATLLAAGGQIYLVPDVTNMGTMLMGNIVQLSSDMQANIYRNCAGTGCKVIVDGVPFLDSYQKSIAITAIGDAPN